MVAVLWSKSGVNDRSAVRRYSRVTTRAELNSLPASVKPEALKLAKQVVSTFDAELTLKNYRDDYTEALRKIIKSKIAGQEVITPEVMSPAPVVDLMEALRKGLGAVTEAKKRPAKARLDLAKTKALGARTRRAS